MAISAPALPGWRHIYSGKVRDLYAPADGAGDRVLVVASDRISAYDFVLPTPIPDKGKILTAMSLWWFAQLADVVGNHVLSTNVPTAVAGRAMVCRRLEMVPVECVVRGYLTGSGLAEYHAGGQVCGVELPGGLTEASALPEPIFTPATKAAVGEHDENVSFAQVTARVGAKVAHALRETSLAVYRQAATLAAARGIILADTKFEFGHFNGQLLLGDEVLTPDSSRFWPADAWRPGQVTPSFDKQYVRDWLTSAAAGWDRAAGAAPPPLPAAVVERTRQRYLEAYQTLTGQPWQ
ncbi:phosphoribosylaminoimidazolesuccinocarboxamide synthase [Buchananella hordeovulneris]|uniref:Phosphoribosylaminoimidazole-succinocarboxamide synthase n=1 Tax=Buchananella hordeovulneris TaxID=52770 RepID=A0A1Q5PTF3_9ACTO|nr:phosphoribosylaminoimidazolesuccinocarboxamide synthase [Buchananella hordeovulneris]OKL50881.1 phosphoribosylaminoimidazolesuccinocarboxamide synthase [Buchananella hordeovulneris]